MMMIKILLICVSFISVVELAQVSSKIRHTNLYYDSKDGLFTGDFFQKNTYIDTLLTPVKSRTAYLKILAENNVSCTGDWCVNGDFQKSPDNSLDYYQVEHIIDLKNSVYEDDDPCKKILGNLIMAYGKWNNQVGKLSWLNVEREKREIYGDFIVDSALLSIEMCKRNSTLYSNSNSNNDHDNNFLTATVTVTFIVVSLLCVTGFIIAFICKKIKERREENTMYISMDTV